MSGFSEPGGFLDRLAQRGQGGARLASLPTLRPVSMIYGAAAASGEPIAEMEQSEPGVTIASSRGQDVASAGQGPDPAPATSRMSAHPSVLAPAAFDRMQSLQRPAVEAIQARSRPAPPRRAEGEATPRPGRARDSQASADPPHGIFPPTREPEGPDQADDGTSAHAKDIPSSALAEAPGPTSRQARSGLGRLFEVIEAVDDTSEVASPAAPRRVSPTESSDGDSGPLVSIGRITITVAPPPVAPAGPARSHGFDTYARLRGGHER